jgi:selenocysteine lyase/cysteine desulfurase
MISSLSDRLNYASLETYTYLNQASLGLVPENAVREIHAFLDNIAKHGNAFMTDQEELDFLEPLRVNAGRLLNASPKNILITSSASEILSQIPSIFEFSKRNKILLVESDFPSVTRPWLALSKQNNNVDIVFVADTANASLTDNIINQIDKNTASVCLSYVQFSTGTKVDIERLQKITHETGVLLVLDITQAAGAIPINLINICPDILVCSGYKWLGGHGGIALGYFSDSLLKKNPHATGWMSALNPFDTKAMELSFPKTANKYTQSTLSYLTAKGLEFSTGEIIALDPVKIEEHSQKLSKYFLSALKGSPWEPFRKPFSTENSSNILSVQNKKNSSKKLAEDLKSKKIFCSLRNGRLRVSIAHYNSRRDIDALLGILL